MDLELAQVAAGLPMAASLAVAGGLASLREGRRRTALNEAMHELRRPLQALALALPEEGSPTGAARSSLSLAVAALERLDREVNGGVAATGPRPVRLGPLLAAAAARWEPRARAAGRPLRLRLGAVSAAVWGEELELAQAVDNLISNAIEHGGGAVTVEVRELEGRLLIAVLDRGRGGAPGGDRSRSTLSGRIGGRGRRGHGLRLVERAAKAHGGSFELRRSADGAEARIELPHRRPRADA